MNSAKNTEKLLKNIAKRLSSRLDCKNVEYRVTIRTEGELTRIIFEPPRSVYPNVHDKKQSDLRKIETHVIVKYFEDIVCKDGFYSGVFVERGLFVDGEYIYKSSVDGRRRKWVRDY